MAVAAASRQSPEELELKVGLRVPGDDMPDSEKRKQVLVSNKTPSFLLHEPLAKENMHVAGVDIASMSLSSFQPTSAFC